MYKNLKALRQSLNMTQKEFAASLGIGYTTYNGYETGAREPKSDFWIAVAQKYRVTIDYLMGYSDDPQKTSTCCADIAALDKELKEFVTEIIREIGFPRGADSQTTITEAKHVFLRVAEIYGEKPAILLRLVSLMNDQGVEKVIDYTKSIFQYHIDLNAPPPQEDK